ncbi:MAG: hypothetical protein ABI824_06530 [Acidobacteriota bacterium]
MPDLIRQVRDRQVREAEGLDSTAARGPDLWVVIWAQDKAAASADWVQMLSVPEVSYNTEETPYR